MNAWNAACEMKLQEVLNAAGVYARTNGSATVRVAEGVYNANTLTDPNDPKSYSFVVPKGVTLEGGWDESFQNRNSFANSVIKETCLLLSPDTSIIALSSLDKR